MTFPKIIEEPCPIVPPGDDDDPPDDEIPILILKPGVATGCAGSIQFRSFLQTPTAGETEITSGAVYQSSNSAIVVIDATTGLAILVSAGQATINVTYGEMHAQAIVTVQGTGSDCCDEVVIASAVVVDDSKSMGQTFGSGTRLDFAKLAANAFFGATIWSKDMAGLIRFNIGGVTVQAISSTAITAGQVNGIGQTTNQTNIETALDHALLTLSGVTADRKVLMLISDGEHRPAPNGVIPSTASVVAKATNFKSGGGILICIGCAAAGDGYALLQTIATNGFFVNAYNDLTQQQALQAAAAFQCYYCGGEPARCCPPPSTGVSEELIPSMTSNTTPSGEVSSSTDGLQDYTPFTAFDYDDDPDNITSYWSDCLDQGRDVFLQYSFDEPKQVSGYRISAITFPTNIAPPASWLFQGSANGSDWITLDTQSGIGGWVDGEVKEFTCEATGEYRHYRLRILSSVAHTGVDCVGVSMLQFLGWVCSQTPPVAQVPNPTPLPDLEITNEPLYTKTETVCVPCGTTGAAVNLVPAMTSNDAPAGEVIAGDVGGFDTGNAYLTFDRTNGTWDLPANVKSGYVGYHFSSAQTITAYTIKTNTITSAPKTFTFEGSNDGSSWDVLHTVADSGAWGSGQTKSFSFTNVTAYEYYRLNISAITGAALVDSWNISEIEMFGEAPILRCATRSASSYVDQATADAAALAAATAAAAALCGVSNNEEPINIPTLGKASPYPSVKVVTDTGTISKVTVSLFGLTHSSPDDIRIVLQSPEGTCVALMVNCGGTPLEGTSQISNVDLVFDDDAADTLPDGPQIVAGTFQPSQYGSGPLTPLESPAPQVTSNAALSAFIGESPTGSWSLWIADDLSVFAGIVSGGWNLTITT